MLYNIGDKVAFFNLDEDFSFVSDINHYLDYDVAFYLITDILDDETIIVQGKSEGRKIPVRLDEYMIHTKESLTETLLSLNNIHRAVCIKIKQLYRKHNNNHGSAFQFSGV